MMGWGGGGGWGVGGGGSFLVDFKAKRPYIPHKNGQNGGVGGGGGGGGWGWGGGSNLTKNKVNFPLYARLEMALL